LNRQDIVLEFRNASFSYRDDIDNVLKDLNLKLKRSEKIGIVGRTGAGKSSITLAISKIIDLTAGDMLVEGKEYRELKTKDLRKNISVIPQEAFIFEGSLERNLDPYRKYSSEQI
jgi:ABC-type multidrug transport system fused ATPase/permease subunit